MTTSPTDIAPITSAVLAAEDTEWELDEPAFVSSAPEDAGVRGLAKAVICRVIAACPPRRWARLSAAVRRVWPEGFRSA